MRSMMAAKAASGGEPALLRLRILPRGIREKIVEQRGVAGGSRRTCRTRKADHRARHIVLDLQNDHAVAVIGDCPGRALEQEAVAEAATDEATRQLEIRRRVPDARLQPERGKDVLRIAPGGMAVEQDQRFGHELAEAYTAPFRKR